MNIVLNKTVSRENAFAAAKGLQTMVFAAKTGIKFKDITIYYNGGNGKTANFGRSSRQNESTRRLTGLAPHYYAAKAAFLDSIHNPDMAKLAPTLHAK